MESGNGNVHKDHAELVSASPSYKVVYIQYNNRKAGDPESSSGWLHFKKAFTLIELLVVVLIIGILTAVAVPQYQVTAGRAKLIKVIPVLRALHEAQKRYYMANGTYTKEMDELDVSVPFKKVKDSNDVRIYYTDLGSIRLYNNQNMIVLDGNSINLPITVNWGGTQHQCYGWSNTGDRICASFGSKQSDTSSSKYPVYKITF